MPCSVRLPWGDPGFQTYFNNHFNQQHLPPPRGANRNESWSVYHRRDLVASCFAWCGTLHLFNRLGWWGDWRGVGHRIRLTNLVEPPTNSPPINSPPTNEPLTNDAPASSPSVSLPISSTSTTNRGWLKKCREYTSYHSRPTLCKLAIIDSLVFLYVLSLFAVAFAYLAYYPYLRLQQYFNVCSNPWQIAKPRRGWGGGRKPRDPCPDAELLSLDYHSLSRYVWLMERNEFEGEVQVMSTKWDEINGRCQ